MDGIASVHVISMTFYQGSQHWLMRTRLGWSHQPSWKWLSGSGRQPSGLCATQNTAWYHQHLGTMNETGGEHGQNEGSLVHTCWPLRWAGGCAWHGLPVSAVSAQACMWVMRGTMFLSALLLATFGFQHLFDDSHGAMRLLMWHPCQKDVASHLLQLLDGIDETLK